MIGLVQKDFPEMALEFINSADYPNITAHYSVFSNPTILVFFEGKEYVRKSKYVSIPELQTAIERIYTMMFS